MKGRGALFLTFILLAVSGVYGQTYSTLQGGPWNQPSTWQNNQVPGAGDDVVIIGPVQLDAGGDYYVHSLTIEPGGKLQSVVAVPTPTMHVTTDVVNRGVVEGQSNLTPLYFYIGRDLVNTGQWKTRTIYFQDTLQHVLRAEPGSYFNPLSILASSATIVSDRDMYLRGVNFRAKKLILQPDFATMQTTTLHFLEGTALAVDEIIGQGNAIAGDSTAFIPGGASVSTPVYQAVRIRGDTRLGAAVQVIDSLVVDDTLRSSGPSLVVVVLGNLVNYGYVNPSTTGPQLSFYCSGDVKNFGYFSVPLLKLTGDTLHYFQTDLNAQFSPGSLYGPNEIIISASPLRFDKAQIEVQKIVLQPGHDATFIQNCALTVDTLEGNGNRLKSPDAYILNNPYGLPVIYRNVIIEGTALINSNITFQGQLINEGVIRIPDGVSCCQKLIMQGDLINNGSILENDINQLLGMDISGNLVNNGYWKSGRITFPDRGPFTIQTDTTKIFQPTELVGTQTTIQSGSTLRFDGTVVSLDSLILQAGDNLLLNQGTTLAVNWLISQGNTISSAGSAYTIARGPMQRPQMGSLVFRDSCFFAEAVTFTGPVKNLGTWQLHSSWLSRTLTFWDRLENSGSIRLNSSGSGLNLDLFGDFANAGFCQANQVEVMGNVPQQISIPDTANFQAPLKLYAPSGHLNYQWERNGIALQDGGHISGSNTPVLTIQPLGSADYGSYRCQYDSAGQTVYSRPVEINNTITGIEPDDQPPPQTEVLPTRYQLFPNFPNPFNPTTVIPYALPQRSYVRLTVHDVLGRVVKILYEGWQSAGYHRQKLDADNLSGGIYFYRLEAGDFVQVRKMVLLR